MNFFDVVFYQPVLNVFYGFYHLIGDVGLAIVFMAFIVRAVMWKFIRDSYITGQKTRQIQPLIKDIQKKYKGDLAGMQLALKEVYAKYDVKPSLSGLVILLQIPVYIALFRLIENVNNGAELHGLYPALYGNIQPRIQGVAFGTIPITDKGWVVYVLAFLTLIFSFLMSRYIFQNGPILPGGGAKPDESKNKLTNTSEDDKKSEALFDPEVFNKTFQFQMTYFMPMLSFIINIQFPAGLNIYFLAGTIFSLIQQMILVKRYKIDAPQIFPEEPTGTTASEITVEPLKTQI
ncbi:MAG: YidC/Oxa1 family membrane protein insertase [Patescibacteria group bacterium]